MGARKDISHLPIEQQEKLIAIRMRKNEWHKKKTLALNPNAKPKKSVLRLPELDQNSLDAQIKKIQDFINPQNPKSVEALIEKLDNRLEHRALELYKPMAKQWEFHNATATYREICFMASNQSGKTHAAAAQIAWMTTGLYPEEYKGKRFGAVTGWVCSITTKMVRDVLQAKLLGEHELGTGLIPKHLIKEVHIAKGSISGAMEIVHIKHTSGRTSTIYFKSYEQGRDAFQSSTIDFVALDEECEEGIYSECLTRTNIKEGLVFLTFTPLHGASEVVNRFYPTPTTSNRCLIQMTIHDATSIYTKERMQEIINSYEPWERATRTLGIPMMGQGNVFSVAEEDLKIDPFPIPNHYLQLIGVDFGIDHYTAAARIAVDPDTNIHYITHIYRQKGKTALEHASHIKEWGKIPVAWPHDGLKRDHQSGTSLADHYRNLGLDMLYEKATLVDQQTGGAGGFGVEASVELMHELMQTGRFKVFTNCNDFFLEFRGYHRKDGKIVDKNDDLISAIRYGLMMIRFAKSKAMSYNSGKPLRVNLRRF